MISGILLLIAAWACYGRAKHYYPPAEAKGVILMVLYVAGVVFCAPVGLYRLMSGLAKTFMWMW